MSRGSDLTFFKHAKNMSSMSDFRRCHTGCVVTYRGYVLATGFNSSKTHPLQKQYNAIKFSDDDTPHCMHSETHALSQLRHRQSEIDWKNVDIYVYREYKNGVRAMARPCKRCMQLIKDFGIKRVHYSTEDGFAFEEISDSTVGL